MNLAENLVSGDGNLNRAKGVFGKSKNTLRTILLSTVFSISMASLAQAALSELVVTAQKRAQNIQDTPISMAAFTGADLAVRGATSIAEVANFTPNVQFDTAVALSGTSNASSIYIRGVGQPDFVASTDPGVGVYLDGVYIARSLGGVLDLLDVERVEVLRGPQGTLFGRNTIGGAISVVSKKPDDEFSAKAELTIGRFDRINAKASVNIPLVEGRLAARIGVSTRNSDGYGRRVLTGETLGGEDTDAIRGMLRFTPNESVEVNFSADYTHSEDESPTSALLAVNSVPGPPAAGGTLVGLYNAVIAPMTGVPLDGSFITGNNRVDFATGPTGSDMDIYGAALTIEWDIGPVTVKSISAYRTWDAEFGRDPDHSPIIIIQQDYEYEQNQFSQELTLSGRSFGDRLDWLLGGYYFDEHAEEFTDVPVVPAVFPAIGLPLSGGGLTEMDNSSYAIFGQGTFQITDQLGLTLGLRYSHEKKEMLNGSSRPQLPGAPFLLADRTGEETFNSLTPRVSIEYKLQDNMLLYASYSEGYKSGGFVSRYLRPAPEPVAFDSEEVVSYEVGFKGDFLDDRLRVNAAAFFSEYDNIQIVVFNFGTPETRNAAKGEIGGAEFEFTFAPSDRFNINGGVGYIDAKYTKIDAGSLVGILVPFDTSADFINTPEFTMNIGADFTVPIADFGDLTLRTDYSYRTKVANDAVNTPELNQSAYGLLSASANLAINDGMLEIIVFGRNLTDKNYIISGTSDINSVGIVEGVFARPREWGVTTKVHF